MLPDKIPVAKEGLPFIGTAALSTVVLALLQMRWPALAGLASTVFILCFFRDPERVTPHIPDLITSPADGKVIDIAEAADPFFEAGMFIRISIFMNIFNCHVNRSPISGTVIDMNYRRGKFLSADRPRAMKENERSAILLEDEHNRKIIVVQVAGFIARRIVCLAEVGDRLRRGQRFGMIRFGSRLDVYVPLESDITVENGDRTVAGETVLCRMKGMAGSQL